MDEIFEIQKLAKHLRQCAMRDLEAGEISQACDGMRRALEADCALTAAKLKRFKDRTESPKPAVFG